MRIFFLLFAVVLPSVANAQFPDCQHVNTDVAKITCAHCEFVHEEPSVVLRRFDLQFFKSDLKKPKFRVSTKMPKYFIDRRGTRHALQATGTVGLYWTTDVCFFSGESGLACFDVNDDVCGVVLGNVYLKGVWLGRVAKLGDAINAISDKRVLSVFNRLGVD